MEWIYEKELWDRDIRQIYGMDILEKDIRGIYWIHLWNGYIGGR